MASAHAPPEEEDGRHRTRTKSALRSFVHKRSPSKGRPLSTTVTDIFCSSPAYGHPEQTSSFLSPADHHRHSRALGEIQQNQQKYAVPLSPTKSRDVERRQKDRDADRKHRDAERKAPDSEKKHRERGRSRDGGEGFRSLHKKTLSAISLKSLSGKDPEKKAKDEKESKPKKSKSSTNLTTLLTSPRSLKSIRKESAETEPVSSAKNKENQPPHSDSPSRPPIYAQYSSEHFTTQPLGGRFLEDGDLPECHSPEQLPPGKHQSFHEEEGLPAASRRREASRPNSLSIPSTYIVQEISRPPSSCGTGNSDGARSPLSPTKSHHRESTALSKCSTAESEATRPTLSRTKSSHHRERNSEAIRPPLSRTKSSCGKEHGAQEPKPTENRNSARSKRGSRIAAAVANGFGSKPETCELKPEPTQTIEDVDGEFEAMLDRRNIPENQRYKMRSLAKSMKIDFIKQDWAELVAARKERPGTSSSTDSVASIDHSTSENGRRPRSRTFSAFTLPKSLRKNKGDNSLAKDGKLEPTTSRHTRTKSFESVSERKKETASASAGMTNSLIARAKGQCPEDFVGYLRKIQKPNCVDDKKLHKLRLLLRNETVAWTDDFIRLGGMQEILGLLQRVMAVEWREDHEDKLLHESLLCLKALCTTALALEHLAMIQETLFPALIHMIFDEEKKGPSEFPTRNIITSLLFTYLQSAPLSERQVRAETLLSYLRDPQPKEEERPVPFVLQMYQERPYRVWCREVVNVTKEVFWIFLHSLNTIDLPSSHEKDTCNGEGGHAGTDGAAEYGYMKAHFPTPLPPPPTAPYVGGVEWDATNYITSHLFLVNGILASLPPSSRNVVRAELRISGWERCMGESLRTCKEKFYGGVHAALRDWVSGAAEDGWDVSTVRFGKKSEESPRKYGGRKREDKDVPRLEMPRLDFEIPTESGGRAEEVGRKDAGWL